MEKVLSEIVSTLLELGYTEDRYRNRKAVNEFLEIQFFKKSNNKSHWESYVSYDPINSRLSLTYYEAFEKERYTVFVVSLGEDLDAVTACELLNCKTDAIWEDESITRKVTTKEIDGRLEGLGFKKVGQDSNTVTRWEKINKSKYTVIVEGGVTPSLYLFSERGNKATPLFALRSIKSHSSFDASMSYIRRKTYDS